MNSVEIVLYPNDLSFSVSFIFFVGVINQKIKYIGIDSSRDFVNVSPRISSAKRKGIV